MNPVLVVEKAGICSTIQDSGRRGYRAYGVPASGALDPVAFTLANRLVGNAADTPAIEMLYSGLTLQLQGGRARIALGADAAIAAPGDTGARVHRAWQSFVLDAGATLRIGTIRNSAAAYLAIEGGVDVPPVLGSTSTYVRGALGGWHGRALKRGDILPLKLAEPSARRERGYSRTPDFRSPDELRVMLGPQVERFEKNSVERLLSSAYTVSSQSDRSGLRLQGDTLRHIGGHDATSEAVATGSIQVPGSGTPVILIGDHPTVGGYPKIATIITADLAAAGRLRIGSQVRFVSVDDDGAARARRQLKLEIAEITSSMADVSDDGQ